MIPLLRLQRLSKTKQTPLFKRFLIHSFLLALLLFTAVSPFAAAADDDFPFSDALISDGYIVLRDEDVQEFRQGYEVSMNGFGTGNVLIEISCRYSDPISLGSIVLEQGETVQCYRRTSNGTELILMMTLDKIYLNNSQLIAGFSHVYQYNDSNFGQYSGSEYWTLYADTLADPSAPTMPVKPPGNGTDIGPDLISEPFYIILIIGFAALAVILVAAFSKRNDALKRKQKKNH